MNLYRNDVINIYFEDNILWVSWQERPTLEAFKPVADTIAACSNQVKANFMIIDARNTSFRKDSPDKSIMDYIVQVVSRTPIKKVARLMSDNASFESKVLFQKLNYDMATKLPFSYQFFTDESEARAWLQAKEAIN